MKKLITCTIAIALLISPTAASAQPHILDKKFKNCSELNKTYKGGVAKSATVVNAGGKTKNSPTVNAKVYKENASKDRDGDGIACEK